MSNELDFKVERLKQEATVFFPDGEVLEGCFFLSPVSDLHGGPQSISELLEEGRRYVPFEKRDGGLMLLPVAAIERIAVSEDQDRHPGSERSRYEAIVRVTFHSLKTVEGTIPFTMPPSHARLSDFLNQGGRFFVMIIQGEPHLINHSRVRSILFL